MEVKINSESYYNYYYVILPDGTQIRMVATALDKCTPKTTRDKFIELIQKALDDVQRKNEFITEIQSKIDYINKTGTDVFDENEYKVYHTLTLIENRYMTKLEKAKEIAALINSK
jgi:hypothetical protein